MAPATEEKKERRREKPNYTSHIMILGQGMSEGKERFVQLKFPLPNGTEQTVVERIDNLAKQKAREDMHERLTKAGAHLITLAAGHQLIERIQLEGSKESSFFVATKLGWVARAFVWPDRVIGTPDQPLEIYLGDIKPELLTKYRVSGTLKAWRRIPRLAKGNSRLMLALALAFVGPLGGLVELEQVAIQLCGAQGSGKTGVAIAAGSVWGLHAQRERAMSHGFGEIWNQTVNNLEPVAAAHNHALLILDETQTAPRGRGGSLAQTIIEAVMRLEKSVEKGRLTDTNPQRVWWVPVLSTSNSSLDEMAQRGEHIDDAHRGRLIDIPLPTGGNGIFENLHDSQDKVALTKRLKRIASKNHGIAAVTYLEKITQWNLDDPEELQDFIKSRRRHYLKHARLLQAPGRDLSRIHEKFATIYAAGRLATKVEVLPWKLEDLRNALLECERAHIEHVSRLASVPASPSLLGMLRDYIRDTKSQFQDLRDGLAPRDHDPRTCLGYINKHKTKTREEYLFTDERLAIIVGGKVNAQKLKRELCDQGLLIQTKAGDQGARFVSKRKLVTGKAPQLVIAVDAAILTG